MRSVVWLAAGLCCAAVAGCGNGNNLELPNDAPPAAEDLLPTVEKAVTAAEEEDYATLCEIDEQNADDLDFSDSCNAEPEAGGEYEEWIAFVAPGDITITGIDTSESDQYGFELQNGDGTTGALPVEGVDELCMDCIGD